jgi:hypothetical protein
MEPTTEIATFNTKLEADLVVAVLAEAGIDAFIVADNLGGAFPMMQMITGGYKVMVLVAIADEAREIVHAPDPELRPERAPQSWDLSKLTSTQMIGLFLLLFVTIPMALFAMNRWIL